MCDERERLIGYVYGECDGDEKQRIDRHLDDCADCRAEIRGLRRTREDLLAWEVPRTESVWKPFAPARVTPWWREVPAWAMAAAATLTFALGAAGGIVTQAVVSAAPDDPAPAVTVVRPGANAAELTDLEAQIRDLREDLRAQTAERVPVVLAQPLDVGLSSEQYEDFLGLVESLYSDFGNFKTSNVSEMQQLQRDVDGLKQFLQVSAPRKQQ